MANSTRSVSRTIYLDTQSAEASLQRLRAEEQRLTQSINQGEAAGRNMTREIGRLSSVQNNIRDVQNQLDRGLRPSLQQQQRLVSQLRNELARMSESDPAFQQRVETYRQANAALQRMLTNLRQVNEAPQPGGGGASSFMVGVGSFVGQQLGAIVDKMKEAASQAIQWALETEGVKRAYDRLNQPGLLDNLRAATKGTVADLDLMKAAVNANNFGIPVDRLGAGLAFAQQRARDTGQSVDYLVESLVTGIARKSPLILDNLGINVARVNEEFKKTGDFAQAAFNIIEEETAKAGPAIDTAADKVSRFKAAWQNGLTSWGEGIVSIAANAFESIEYNFADTQGKIQMLQQRESQVLQKQYESAYQTELHILKDFRDRYEKQEKEYWDAHGKHDKEGRDKIIQQAQYEADRTQSLQIEALLRGDNQLAASLEKRGKLWRDYLNELNNPNGKAPETLEGIKSELSALNELLDKQIIGSQKFSDTQKRIKELQKQMDDATGKTAEEAQKKAEQANEKRVAALKQFSEFLEKINDDSVKGQIPKTIQPVIDALNNTRDAFQKLNEFREKAKLSDQQYADASAAIYKRQADEIAKYTSDTKVNFKPPVNASTSAITGLPEELANTISGLTKAMVEMPIELIPPDITPEEEKKLKEIINNTLKNITKDGLEYDVLTASNSKGKKNALLAQLEYEHQQEMANKDLTDNEKLRKEQEFQEKKQEIIDQYNSQIVNGFMQGLEYFGQALSILDNFSAAADASRKAQLDKELADNDKKKTALKKQLDSKLISQQQYDERTAALDLEADNKKKKLEKDQFERNKKIQIAQALINGFMGVTAVLAARPGPADIFTLGITRAINIAFTLAATAAQIGSIAGQKYARGGYLNGPSHSNGGMPVINPVTGAKEAEVEGGEVILSKNTVRNNAGVVSSLLFNSMHRNGARLTPFWENRSYKAFDYAAVNKSLRYATGGVMFEQATAAASTDSLVAAQLQQTNAVNMALMEEINQLRTTLAGGIQATVSQKRLGDATAVRQSIQNDSAWN